MNWEEASPPPDILLPLVSRCLSNTQINDVSSLNGSPHRRPLCSAQLLQLDNLPIIVSGSSEGQSTETNSKPFELTY